MDIRRKEMVFLNCFVAGDRFEVQYSMLGGDAAGELSQPL